MNRPAISRVSPSTLSVRRRSAAERRVLMLLRGEDEDANDPAASPAPIYFTELRHAATAAGLAIQAPDVPYVSGDEVLLLGWIAQEQRTMNYYAIAIPHDPVLIAAVARCAGLLDAMGVRLGPRTIFAASLK